MFKWVLASWARFEYSVHLGFDNNIRSSFKFIYGKYHYNLIFNQYTDILLESCQATRHFWHYGTLSSVKHNDIVKTTDFWLINYSFSRHGEDLYVLEKKIPDIKCSKI